MINFNTDGFNERRNYIITSNELNKLKKSSNKPNNSFVGMKYKEKNKITVSNNRIDTLYNKANKNINNSVENTNSIRNFNTIEQFAKNNHNFKD